MNLEDLPLVNACLNGLSTILLAAGYWAICRGDERWHRNFMVAALATSALFLASYLTYHFQVPRTVFREPSWFRPYYLVILGTHTVLAMLLLPMVMWTVWLAWRDRRARHRRWARWTWPIWMYVSVTGVLIYLLLYQIYPQRRFEPEPVAKAETSAVREGELPTKSLEPFGGLLHAVAPIEGGDADVTFAVASETAAGGDHQVGLVK